MLSAVSSAQPFTKLLVSHVEKYKNRTLALIVGELEYWASRCTMKTHPKGFYKFSAPCNHRDYREGDSWSEKLNIAPQTFNRLFKKVGISYATRTSFEDAVSSKGFIGSFHGKEWLKYYERNTNRTYFLRNPEYGNGIDTANEPDLAEKLNRIKMYLHNLPAHQQNQPRHSLDVHTANEPDCVKKFTIGRESSLCNFPTHQQYEHLSSDSPRRSDLNNSLPGALKPNRGTKFPVDSYYLKHGSDNVKKNFTLDQKFLHKNLDNGRGQIGDRTKCSVRTEQNVQSRIYIESKITTKNTSHAESVPSKAFPVDNSLQQQKEKKSRFGGKTAISSEIVHEMLRIWEEIVENGSVKLEATNRRIAFLKQAFKDKFDLSFNKWREYCQKIASSKYLMGEKVSWKVDLDWALKFESIRKIFEGKLYGLGDRQLQPTRTETTSREHEVRRQIVSSLEHRVLKDFRLKFIELYGVNTYISWIRDADTGLVLREKMITLLAKTRFQADYLSSSKSFDLQVVLDNLGSSVDSLSVCLKDGSRKGFFEKNFFENNLIKDTIQSVVSSFRAGKRICNA